MNVKIKPKKLAYILARLQSSVEQADPKLARSLVAEPPRRPNEPFLIEYLDRLITALQERLDRGHLCCDPALPIYAQMIPTLQRIRAAAATGR